MHVRHSRMTRLVALTVVAAMPLLGMAGVASAKTAKASAAKCLKHPNRQKCQAAGGGATGSGSGGAPAQMTITVSPNPLVETGQSEIHAIVQIETLPSFAGDVVNVDSSQLTASCALVQFVTNERGSTPGFFTNHIGIALDDDGNTTVALYGQDCAPGTSVIEADLEVAPFLTAITTLVANPPVVTPEGLTGYPNNEVETGDTTGLPNPSGDSDVYAVFYVETNPVYAEQSVEIDSAQLDARCITGWWFQGGNGGSVQSEPLGTININGPSSILDDDGNAVFVFFGQSCAAGPSEVIADVLAGTRPTYTFNFNIDPPAASI
jgi:hypothetical protein